MALKRKISTLKQATKKVVAPLKFTKLTNKKTPAVSTNRVKTRKSTPNGANSTLILQEIKILMTEIQTKLQKLDH